MRLQFGLSVLCSLLMRGKRTDVLRTAAFCTSQRLSVTGSTPQAKALLSVFLTFAHRCSFLCSGQDLIGLKTKCWRTPKPPAKNYSIPTWKTGMISVFSLWLWIILNLSAHTHLAPNIHIKKKKKYFFPEGNKGGVYLSWLLWMVPLLQQ